MSGKVENALYLVNGGVYLHIADSGDRFDYTIYDKETMRQVYHGQLDVNTVREQPAQGIFNAARCAVFEDCGINAVTVEEVPLDMLQKLKNIQLDPPLDEYPRPDYGCTMADIACTGYLKGDLLPVADDIAKDLSQKGFRIYEVDTRGNVKGHVDVNSSCHNLFAVSRAGWQNSRGFREAVADRMKHQTERELTFRCQSQDCFAIYQLHHHDPDLRYIRYEPLESLQKQGQQPQRNNYELVYTAPLPEGTGLNTLWTKFNTDHPPDYQHPSMSVSDVIAVKRNGTITCYYVNQSCFAVLDNFLAQRPRQAELGKPSIKRQLAAKPVSGDHPAKPRDWEAR